MNAVKFVKECGIEVAKRTLDNAIGFGCSEIELFGGKYVFRTDDLKNIVDAYEFVSAHGSAEIARKYCDLHDPYGTSNHYNSLRAKIELMESCDA